MKKAVYNIDNQVPGHNVNLPVRQMTSFIELKVSKLYDKAGGSLVRSVDYAFRAQLYKFFTFVIYECLYELECLSLAGLSSLV
jgi:hypothetical protein